MSPRRKIWRHSVNDKRAAHFAVDPEALWEVYPHGYFKLDLNVFCSAEMHRGTFAACISVGLSSVENQLLKPHNQGAVPPD